MLLLVLNLLSLFIRHFGFYISLATREVIYIMVLVCYITSIVGFFAWQIFSVNSYPPLHLNMYNLYLSSSEVLCIHWKKIPFFRSFFFLSSLLILLFSLLFKLFFYCFCFIIFLYPLVCILQYFYFSFFHIFFICQFTLKRRQFFHNCSQRDFFENCAVFAGIFCIFRFPLSFVCFRGMKWNKNGVIDSVNTPLFWHFSILTILKANLYDAIKCIQFSQFPFNIVPDVLVNLHVDFSAVRTLHLFDV